MSDDLSRSTNRVETFVLKDKAKVIAMRGYIAEVSPDTTNDTKYFYNFIAMTNFGQIHTIQCEATDS